MSKTVPLALSHLPRSRSAPKYEAFHRHVKRSSRPRMPLSFGEPRNPLALPTSPDHARHQSTSHATGMFSAPRAPRAPACPCHSASTNMQFIPLALSHLPQSRSAPQYKSFHRHVKCPSHATVILCHKQFMPLTFSHFSRSRSAPKYKSLHQHVFFRASRPRMPLSFCTKSTSCHWRFPTSADHRHVNRPSRPRRSRSMHACT